MYAVKSDYLLSEAFASYLATESAQKMPRGQQADAYFLEITLYFLEVMRGKKYVNEVHLEDLQMFQIWLGKRQEVRGKIKEEWSDTTTEFYSRILKKFFRKAHHQDYILKNPCELWKVPRGTSERRRPMTLEEYEKVYSAAPEWFKPALKFIMLTGSRGKSLETLTWGDVDFETKTLILKSRKGGLKKLKRIPIPLHSRLLELMPTEKAKVPAREKDPVFWGPQGTPITAQEISSEGSRLIRKVVKLKGVVLYGLRHAIAVEMTKAKLPLETIRQAMGHSSVTQTSHYAQGIGLDVVSDAFEVIRKDKTGDKD